MSRLSLIAAALTAFATLPALADPAAEAAATREEIKATMGFVPTYATQFADAATPGLWLQAKQLSFGEDTALDAKTKALISLAVAAQIPCQYCVVSDTADARRFGASDQQIAEAVAVAGFTRNLSTQFYGLQVDMSTFRAEMVRE